MENILKQKVYIRNCSKKDVEALNSLWIELGITQSWKNRVKHSEIQREYRESYLRSIKEEPCGCFIAISDGELVGSARAYMGKIHPKLYPCGKIGIIGPVVIKKNFRRIGIGTSLMECCCKYLKYKRCDFAVIHVFGNNIPAIKFYEKLGFRALGGSLTLMLLKLWVKLGAKPSRARKLAIRMVKRLY